MKDKEKQAQAARRHYLANKAEMKARAKKYSKEVASVRNRAHILEYKLKHPCVDCAESDPVVLQFHHVGDKTANLGDSSVRYWSLERLKREIEKCVVVCANCHLRRHYAERLSSSVGLERPAHNRKVAGSSPA